MAQNQTVETKESVNDFIMKITDEKKRKDFSVIVDLISAKSGYEPKMWGPGIVGFGKYHYKYESGREGNAPLLGIAPRANSITLYFGTKFENSEELYSKFGKYKLNGGCVQIKKLEDIDTDVMIKMALNSIEHTRKLYPE